MKTKFDQFFMLEIFCVIINQMSSSQIGRDSYYYSIAEDNKRISDDWSIFQNLFVAIIVIGLICVWFESSTEELPETSENSNTNVVVQKLSTTSVSTQSENASPSVVDTTNLLNVESCTTSRSILRSSNDNDNCKGITSSPNVRSLLRSPKVQCDNNEGRNSKTPKARRNLRFCDPEKSEESAPLRRSLRLNTPKDKSTNKNDPAQFNSSEVLYCKQWCQRHGRKKKRSRSRSRSSSSSRSRSRSQRRSSPRNKQKPR